MKEFLKWLTKKYEEGEPVISDDHYDLLEGIYGNDDVGATVYGNTVKHLYPMYSLQKVFDDEPAPTGCTGEMIKTPKLDGAAIELVYQDGFLVIGSTRGDGIEGQDISDKVLNMESVPKHINMKGNIQITGEVVTAKEADNARNNAAGSLNVKDLQEFKERELYFVAYSIKEPKMAEYSADLDFLETQGFTTVKEVGLKDKFNTDGIVYRVNSNAIFKELGHTSKHPRGAYARKIKKDVKTLTTPLLEVIWQTGASGKVTPVSIFEEIVIEDAKINRATLHNVGFIENLDLDIGDTLLVTRSGGVIPKVLGKV